MTTENRTILGDISNTAPPAIDLTGKGPKPPAKRPAPADETSDVDDGYERRSIFDKDCNQVRRMIHRLIDNGAMKVGEFCNAINVSNKSYNNFMKQGGAMNGIRSDTFVNSILYFEWREEQGLKLPTAATNKKQKQRSEEATPQEETGEKSKKTTKTRKDSAVTAADLAGIPLLPKEDKDEVEIYDSCDEVRKKINNYLREPGVTQAQFCRDLSEMLHTPKKPKSIQSRQLTAFRDKKGPDAGNTSVVYYAAYIFFEKLRLKDGKPKSNHRKGMEEAWGELGGMNIKMPSHTRGVWVGPDVKSVKQDQFGRYNVTY